MPSEQKLQVKELKKIFQLHPQIKLVYLFGSQANGKTGPMSDYDFAVYLDEKNPKKIFDLKLKILVELNRLLKTDTIDLVILNNSDSPELNYDIIKEGELIYEKEHYKLVVEPKILNEYFDFYAMLKKYNLTRV